MNIFRFWLTRNARTAFSIPTLLFFSIFVGITRGMLENLLFGIDSPGSDILAYSPFYFSLPFFYAALISLLPPLKYSQVLQSVTFATLLGILPPVLDFILGAAKTHSVFYGYYLSHDYGHFPWLGYAPERSYPLGEAITIWLTFLLVAVFVFAKTRSVVYGILGIAVGYVAFLVYSLVIPGAVSLILFGWVQSPVFLAGQGAARLRQSLFLMSAAQVLIAWFLDACMSGLALQYLKRILHFLPFLFLTLLGATISQATTEGMFVAFLVTTCSGIAVIAQNDFLDSHQRGVGLANAMAVIVFVMVLFSGYKLALFGIACFSLSVLYHYEFFNIRRTLFGSMKVEGFWALFTYLTGVFAGGIKHPNSKVMIISLLVFGGFSLFSVLKDAKDLRADFKEKRNTIYTFLFRRKIRLGRFQRICAIVLGILLSAAGLLYYAPAKPSFFVHLLITVLSVLAIMRIHRKLYFQVFMVLVCGLILNLIYYEGHYVFGF